MKGEPMKAITYLERIKKQDAQIDALIEEIATLDAIAKKTTSVLGDERVQASTSQQKMADTVEKIVILKAELNEQIDKFVDCRNETLKVISEACDADCYKLIHKRHIGTYDEEKERIIFKTWEQIAVEMGFTYQWVSDGLHKRALSQVQKVLDERGAAE